MIKKRPGFEVVMTRPDSDPTKIHLDAPDMSSALLMLWHSMDDPALNSYSQVVITAITITSMPVEEVDNGRQSEPDRGTVLGTALVDG